MIGTERERIQNLFAALMSSKLHEFPSSGYVLAVGDEQGVYAIHGTADEVLHVGCTYRGKRGMYQRLRNHLQAASSFVDEYFDNDGSPLRNGCGYRFLAVEDSRMRILLEAYAIGSLCPAHIGLHEERSAK